MFNLNYFENNFSNKGTVFVSVSAEIYNMVLIELNHLGKLYTNAKDGQLILDVPHGTIILKQAVFKVDDPVGFFAPVEDDNNVKIDDEYTVGKICEIGPDLAEVKTDQGVYMKVKISDLILI